MVCLSSVPARSIRIIKAPMQVEDNESTTCVESPDYPSPQSSPCSVRELFNSEQYRLAMSGYSTPLISVLIGNPKLHQVLLDEMLQIRDEDTEESQGAEEIENLPFRIFELFSLFEDVYSSYMFGYNSKTVLENHGRDLLARLFKVFQPKEAINETAVGYLFKLIDLVLAKHDSTLLFQFIRGNSMILENLASHFESLSSVDIVFKMMETDQQVQPDQKVEVVRRVCSGVVSSLKERPEEGEESLLGLKYLSEKILDKNNIRKLDTTQLAEFLLDQEVVTLLSQILRNDYFRQEVHLVCLQILNLLLRQFKNKEQSTTRANQSKGARFFGKALSKVKIMHPTSGAVEMVVETLQEIIPGVLKLHMEAKKKHQTPFHFELAQTLQLLALYSSSEMEPLLSEGLLTWMLQGMSQHPFNNLYHNCGKEVLLVAISTSSVFSAIPSYSDLNFFQFLCDNFLADKDHCFGPHLFCMIGQIIKNTSNGDIEAMIQAPTLILKWNSAVQKYKAQAQKREKPFNQNQESDEDQMTCEDPPQSLPACLSLGAHMKEVSEEGTSSLHMVTTVYSASVSKEEKENEVGLQTAGECL